MTSPKSATRRRQPTRSVVSPSPAKPSRPLRASRAKFLSSTAIAGDSMAFKFGEVKIDAIELASRGNAVLGIRDSGKTYTATALAEIFMGLGIPIIAFDPVGVWRFLRMPGKGRGYPVVIAGGVAGDLPLTVKTAPEIVRAALKAGVSLVIDLFSPEFSKMDWKRIVAACVEVLIYENAQYGLRHVFIEEAAEFAPQRVGRDQGVVYAQMEKLARMGGNSRLGFTVINQRAEELNKAVLELCDNLLLHRQKGRNSLKALSKWFEAGDVEDVKPIMATMANLPSGECWLWLKDHPDVKRIKVPQKSSLHPDRRVMHGGAGASIPTAKKAVDVGAFVASMTKILHTEMVPQLKQKKALAKPAAKPAKGETLMHPETAFFQQKQKTQLKEEFERGHGEGYHLATIKAGEALEAAIKKTHAPASAAIRKAIGDLDRINRDAIAKMVKALATFDAAMAIPVKIPPTKKGKKTRYEYGVGTFSATPIGRTPKPEMIGGDASLTKPQLALLRSLAWWRAMGHDSPTRVQVATICKWKTTGSNVKDRISELYRLGHISKPGKETVSLTASGIAAAPEPDMSASVIDSLKEVLTGPQMALLEEIPENGDEITREDACAALQWQQDGSNIKDRISELFRLEIISKPTKETIARQEWVR